MYLFRRESLAQSSNIRDSMAKYPVKLPIPGDASMRSVKCSLAAIALLGLVGSVRADDEARKIVDKAIKAHGGADKLAKFKDKSILMKSKMKIFEPMELDATMESSVAGEKFRHVLQLNVMGMDISQTIVYDGKEMWI